MKSSYNVIVKSTSLKKFLQKIQTNYSTFQGYPLLILPSLTILIIILFLLYQTTIPTMIASCCLIVLQGLLLVGLFKKAPQPPPAPEVTTAAVEKNQTMGLLVGGISHELKTPLTSIMGFAELCLQKIIKKSADINEIKEYLKIIIQSSDHCLIIIQDLLDFAKPTRTDKKVFRAININNCIDATIKIIMHHMKIKNILINKEYDENIPLIKGNYNQIRQVLLNLLINARDAIDRNGTITIKTFTKDQNVVAIIQDNGGGIDQDALAHIFEPFFTTKEKGKGTGLGLPVSLELIKEHKGTLRIESQVNQGTQAIISIPLTNN